LRFLKTSICARFQYNGDDVRFLMNDKNTVLDSYTFGATPANASWHRTPDGGAWASTTTSSPTKNSSNNPILTSTFKSQGIYDGWILESTEVSNIGGTLSSAATTFNLGDSAADKQYRTILSFNTGRNLPDTAVITKVTLKIKRPTTGFLVGNNNPFTWGLGLKADVCKNFFGTTVALQLADFNYNNATNCKLLAGSFGNAPTASWYSANILNTAFAKINKTGLTQFRLRFSKDDNDDGLADYFKFFSGNAGTASRPQLIIQYYVP
jgi:hypothetical protein